MQRSASVKLCLFSLLFAALLQASISYELTHEALPAEDAARTFTVIVMILLACALAFAFEAGSALLFILIAAACIATAFFPDDWMASNSWVFYWIFAPIAIVFAIGFLWAPGLFKRLSYHANAHAR